MNRVRRLAASVRSKLDEAKFCARGVLYGYVDRVVDWRLQQLRRRVDEHSDTNKYRP
jgi:hypothetical protein